MKKNVLILFILSIFGTSVIAQESMNMELLYSWKNDTLPPSFFFDNTYNEIWGYQADGREYAIIGTTMGTHIFDVTDPVYSEEIHFIEAAYTGGNVVHRDYDDYLGYLYAVCDEGPSTLQIIDLNNLPESVEVVYDSNEILTRSHNIFIDKDSGIMYNCGGTTFLSLYDISDPINPSFIMDCGEEIEGWGSSVGYVHDIYVRDGMTYCNAGGNGLYIVDFSDLSEVSVVGSLTEYEESGYNHSGWLHPDGDIYALADETHGTRIKIIDVSDPTDINVISLIGSGITENSIAHNLIFDGDYLHVSYYYDGYYIFDISDPANPTVAAYYDTSTEVNYNSYKGAWGVYPLLSSGNLLVSDMQEGLFVFSSEFSTGIEQSTVDQNEIQIFPNPIDPDNVRISGLPLNEQFQFELVNNLGQIVDSGNFNSNQKSKITLQEQSLGIYYLNLHSEQKSYHKKIYFK